MRTVIEATRGPADETAEGWAEYARQALAAIAARETLESPDRIAAVVVSLMPSDPRDYPKVNSDMDEWIAGMHKEHSELVVNLAQALAALRWRENDAPARVARAVSAITSELAPLLAPPAAPPPATRRRRSK